MTQSGEHQTDLTHPDLTLEELVRDMQQAQRLAKVGSWRINHTTGDLYWSEEVYRIFGRDPQGTPLDYETFLSFVHPDDREAVNEAWTTSLEERKPYAIVHRMRLEDGTVKYVQELADTEFDEAGNPVRSYGSVQDISERIDLENKLKRSLHLLRTAQEISKVGQWEWDIVNDKHSWSEEIYQIYGRDSRLPPAVKPELKTIFTEESWIRLDEAVQRCLRDGTPYKCEAEVLRENGNNRWIIAYGYRETDLLGNPTRLYGFVRDVSISKKFQADYIKSIMA